MFTISQRSDSPDDWNETHRIAMIISHFSRADAVVIGSLAAQGIIPGTCAALLLLVLTEDAALTQLFLCSRDRGAEGPQAVQQPAATSATAATRARHVSELVPDGPVPAGLRRADGDAAEVRQEHFHGAFRAGPPRCGRGDLHADPHHERPNRGSSKGTCIA
jgi:hypothetical protein